MPFEIMKTKQHVCMHSYACVTQTTINVCIVCVSACICLWTGQMGKSEEQSQMKKKDDSREKEKRRENRERGHLERKCFSASVACHLVSRSIH